LALRYRVLGRRYGRLVLEHVEGMPLLVLPQVFNPALFRTSAFLVQTLAARGPAAPNQTALDLGAGSGVGALAAARMGYGVVAVDINAEAVRNTRINVLLNCQEGRVDVRQGNVFEPVRGERFDLVLFNPPFYQGTPRDALDQAWRGTGVFEAFAHGLREALRPGGQALVVLSTDGDGAVLLARLREQGLRPRVVAQRDLLNEVITVYAVGTEA
jgi:release factor glutamine methyltransferase